MIEELNDFSSFEFDGDMSSGAGSATTSDPRLPNGAALAVVDNDQAVRDYLANQLGEGVACEPSVQSLETRFGMGPIVVVLGPSCTSTADLAIVERWTKTNPEVGCILVTSELTTTLLQTALRAGVKDVISAPIDQIQLVETVGRVAEGLTPQVLQTINPEGGEAVEDHDHEGQIISIFSTKGGSGKSVTATNLAVSLARRSDKPVVLIDAHLQFGDVAVMLKLQPQHTVVDAISQLDRLDVSLIRDLLTVHEESGLLVLPAPLEPAFADQITGAQMVRLVELVKSFAGHVIVDMPSFFNDVVLSVLDKSDEIILVAGLDIPNIKNVKLGYATLALLDIPKEKLHLILNRADSKVKLDVGEVEKTLQVQAIAHVPSDVTVPISVNKGSPVVISAAKSGVARAFEQLAGRFLDSPAAVEKTSTRRKFFG